ncbi:MAG: hypothetical protein HYS23_15145 [Geobacter sp.]|nr:hypothetical protein [Geobacter sp.]
MISHWHVAVAAEAVAAAQFARIGLDVSVQYGANQPEFDLVVVRGERLLKVSVKGSQDGKWGLTQQYLRRADYLRAANRWLAEHHHKTILCFVQFYNVPLDGLPRVYVARPEEVAQRLKESSAGRGDTILYEYHVWGPRSQARGTTDEIPDEWAFSKQRVLSLLDESL